MQCNYEYDLGRQIYMTGQNLRNFAEKVMAPFAVTLEQFQILKCLAFSSSAGLSQRQIGIEVFKTPANITRILDRLESKNLLHRTKDPADRRASLVVLADAGRALVDEVTGIFDSFSAELVAGVSEAEQQVMRRVFAKITENIAKMSKQL